MATKNDVTGDSIQSKKSSKNFRDNYENIWKKPDDSSVLVREDSDTDNETYRRGYD
tara:strand:- start:228 stop:395 length:168 start_codon:yes stop_codon:yes gene_type:complete